MSTRMPFEWTPAKVEALKKMITVDGLSYAEAAAMLGCSRNAALGKANRLKIASPNGKGMSETKKMEMAKRKQDRERGKAKVQAEAAQKAKQRELDAKKAKLVEPVKQYKTRVRLPPEFHDDAYFKAFLETKNISFREDILNIPALRQCKWITGDVRAHRARWCRKPVDGTSQYCHDHRRIVYVPHSEYRRRRR